MILVDTSAWVEFLRDTGSPTCREVDRLLGGDLATCDPVRMEVLAGALSPRHAAQLRGLLAGTRTLRTEPADYDSAAGLYRTCRQGGETVRRMIDCLIAAVALREGAQVLHCDADFDVLARHTGVGIHAPRT